MQLAQGIGAIEVVKRGSHLRKVRRSRPSQLDSRFFQVVQQGAGGNKWSASTLPGAWTLKWHDPAKRLTSAPTFLDLIHVQEVRQGIATPVFKEAHMTGKAALDPRECFSIVAKDRTVDIVCSSEEERLQWQHGISALLSPCCGAGASGQAVEQLRQTLWEHIRHGRLAAMLQVLQAEAGLMHSSDSISGDTPLLFACRVGNSGAVTELIVKGALVDPHSSWGQTALQVAVDWGRSECVKVLLSAAVRLGRGAQFVDLRCKDDKNRTAVHLAAKRGDVSILHMLLQAGGSADQLDGDGRSPLHIAALCAGNPGAIGSFPYHARTAMDWPGQATPKAPLPLKTDQHHAQCAEILLEHGGKACLFAGDNFSRVPLHYAAMGGDYDMVETLLDVGADASIVDAAGAAPCDLAEAHGHEDIAERLSSVQEEHILRAARPKRKRGAGKVAVPVHRQQSAPVSTSRDHAAGRERRRSKTKPHQDRVPASPWKKLTSTAPKRGILGGLDLHVASPPPLSPHALSDKARIEGGGSVRTDEQHFGPCTPDRTEHPALSGSSWIRHCAVGFGGAETVWFENPVSGEIRDQIDLEPALISTSSIMATPQAWDGASSARHSRQNTSSVPHAAAPYETSTAGAMEMTSCQGVNGEEYGEHGGVVAEDGYEYYFDEEHRTWYYWDWDVGGWEFWSSEATQSAGTASWGAQSDITAWGVEEIAPEVEEGQAQALPRRSVKEHVAVPAQSVFLAERVDQQEHLAHSEPSSNLSVPQTRTVGPTVYAAVDVDHGGGSDDGQVPASRGSVEQAAALPHQKLGSEQRADSLKQAEHVGQSRQPPSSSSEACAVSVVIPPKESGTESTQTHGSAGIQDSVPAAPQVPCEAPMGESLGTFAEERKSNPSSDRPPSSWREDARFALLLDPKFDKYVRMLRMGIPAPAVESKLKMDGMESSSAAAFTSAVSVFMREHGKAALRDSPDGQAGQGQQGGDSKPSAESGPQTSNKANSPETGPKSKEKLLLEHPVLAKYSKMLKLGIPLGAAKGKMIQDGQSQALIDDFIRAFAKSAHEADSLTSKPRTATRPTPTGPAPAKPDADAHAAARKRRSRVPLLKLHWIPLATTDVADSVWASDRNKAPSSIAALDSEQVAELESMFAKKASKKPAPATKARAPSTPKTVHLIDSKRAYNAGIGLAQFKHFKGARGVAEAVMGSTAKGSLTPLQMEALLDLLPTPSEEKVLSAFRGNRKALGPVERWFDQARAIPRFAHITRAALAEHYVEPALQKASQEIEVVRNACKKLMQSEHLKALLATTLAVGNVMNEGTAQGEAAGFAVESLLRLTTTKAADKKTSLMDYVVRTVVVKQRLPLAAAAQELMQVLSKAKRVSMSDTRATLETAIRQVEGAQREAKLVKEAQSKACAASAAPAGQGCGEDKGQQDESEGKGSPAAEAGGGCGAGGPQAALLASIRAAALKKAKKKASKAKASRAKPSVDVKQAVSPGVANAFAARMEAFASTHASLANDIREQCEQAAQLEQRLAKYFGESPGPAAAGKVYSVLLTFLGNLLPSARAIEREMEAAAAASTETGAEASGKDKHSAAAAACAPPPPPSKPKPASTQRKRAGVGSARQMPPAIRPPLPPQPKPSSTKGVAGT